MWKKLRKQALCDQSWFLANDYFNMKWIEGKQNPDSVVRTLSDAGDSAAVPTVDEQDTLYLHDDNWQLDCATEICC